MPKRKPNDPDRSPDLPHNWINRHLERVEELLYFNPINIDKWKYRRAQLVSEGVYKQIDDSWSTINIGGQWGGRDVTAFFEKEITIPSELIQDTDVQLVMDIDLDGGECQLKINGTPWQGLDCFRSIIPLGDRFQGGQKLKLEMEAFVINYPYDARRNDEKDIHSFSRARFMLMDQCLSDFLYDARFILDAYLSYWQDNSNLEIEEFLLNHLEEVCSILGSSFSSREEARELCKRGSDYLRKNIYESSFYRSRGIVNLCGHSHLDVVYLWPSKETFRKNSRTATNALSLMREFPDFKFSSSQPYLFEKLKEMYPAVYEEVKQRIKEKRWEVTGGMYIEPDGNLLGGESLVRQIMFGKKFYQDEFGINTQVCWLPDVFGVMYTLPQILKKSGINYFSSIKLNVWNDTNDFPYNTFRWRGPDGSEVLAHFPPTHFAVDCKPELIRKNWSGYKEKNKFDESLFLFGWADGGGGPTREMAEYSKRSKSFPGLPKCEMTFVEDYLKKIDTATDLPVWDDEFYLEAHRGTYTTKAVLKKLNRKNEILYRNAEILSAIAFANGMKYTQEKINRGWKLLLLNQFHDTITGTHVAEAVPDIMKDYKKLELIANEVQTKAISFLLSKIKGDHDFVLFNTLSWDRNSVISLPYQENCHAIDLGGVIYPCQKSKDRLLVSPDTVPSMGWICGSYSNKNVNQDKTVSEMKNGVESNYYIIKWNKDGFLNSLYDKENNHNVLSGLGNEFIVYEDDPGKKFGAWDIAHHIEKYRYQVESVQNWTQKSNGPVFAEYEAQWKVLNSSISQTMRIYKKNKQIEFDSCVHWSDSKKLLKCSFDLAIRSRKASYDLPFGHIERATHRNTSWDQARFEVCGHKWADISEADYGFTLMNDCKYGYDAKDNILRLSLLRSPVSPDPASDIGEHRFSYAILPHKGNWQQGQVDRRAYEFNIPVITSLCSRETAGDGSLSNFQSFLKLEGNSQIVEAVKVSEDSQGLIVRSFDSHGTHSAVSMSFDNMIQDCQNTDLLENNEGTLIHSENEIPLRFTPMEIKTTKVFFKDRLL